MSSLTLSEKSQGLYLFFSFPEQTPPFIPTALLVTKQHSNIDDHLSEEEDNTDYQPEDKNASDKFDEEVTGTDAAPAFAET